MLDQLAQLAKKPWAWGVAGILVFFAVFAPLVAKNDRVTTATTTTTSTSVAPTTSTTVSLAATTVLTSSTASVPALTVATTVPPATTRATTATTAAPATTVPATAATTTVPSSGAIPVLTLPTGTPTNTTAPGSSSTADELNHKGDFGNPGALYPERTDKRGNDQERLVGASADPARLGGYSIWVVKVSVEAKAPDGVGGPWLKVTFRVINRDYGAHPIKQSQWTLQRPDTIAVPPNYATPILVPSSDLPGRSEAYAEVWFPITSSGRHYINFRPSDASTRGLWAVDIK